MKNYPTIITCSACFRADDVQTPTIDPLTGNWDYVCTNPSHGETPHRWVVIPPAPVLYAASHDGYLADLGVYDDLLTCIQSDDGWLEYGVVEDRFRRCAPETYARLVREFSHSARNAIRGGPDVNPDARPKTSSRLASALSYLAGDGVIAKSFKPATGYWRYNTVISHWGPLPAPSDADVLTWEEYATANNLESGVWILPPGR
jgi:hypothetical protein